MRAWCVSLFLCGSLAADVVVLRDGTRVAGKVADKNTHYEVTTDAGVRTYPKDEVERVLATPREILGDADQLWDEAKRGYQDAGGRQDKIREAVAKLTKVRDAYASARELFPEDKYSDLDQKLLQIMQLMRLMRDQLGSEIARRPSPKKEPVEAQPMRLEEALAVLREPAQRADAAFRETARSALRAERRRFSQIYDLITAAMLVLSRSDAEWKLEGDSLRSLQEYYAKPWWKEPEKLTPLQHLAAAGFLAERIETLRKGGTAAPEPHLLMACGHLGYAPVQEAMDVGKRLSLVAVGGRIGSAEGHAVADLDRWIADGDFDLAVLAFQKNYRWSADTSSVRYVWAWAMVRLAQDRKRGFERAVKALQEVKTIERPWVDHLAALAKSVNLVAVCSKCAGEGRLRCTNCHGRKEIKFVCKYCNGTGKRKQKDGFELDNCTPCKSSGFEKTIRCEKCKDGFNDCPQCKEPRTAPALEDICEFFDCPDCEGRGSAFRGVRWTCRTCRGVGLRIVPKADPSKTL